MLGYLERFLVSVTFPLLFKDGVMLVNSLVALYCNELNNVDK